MNMKRNTKQYQIFSITEKNNIEKIKYNESIRKRHKETCKTLNCIAH